MEAVHQRTFIDNQHHFILVQIECSVISPGELTPASKFHKDVTLGCVSELLLEKHHSTPSVLDPYQEGVETSSNLIYVKLRLLH